MVNHKSTTDHLIITWIFGTVRLPILTRFYKTKRSSINASPNPKNSNTFYTITQLHISTSLKIFDSYYNNFKNHTKDKI